MTKKKKKDKTISQIISNRPSYSGIYSPDQAIKPKYSPKKDDGIWFPPKLSFLSDDNLIPLEESDNDSFLRNLSLSNLSATYEEGADGKLAARESGGATALNSIMNKKQAILEDEEKSGDGVASRGSAASLYDEESFAEEEIIEEDEIIEEVEVDELEEEESVVEMEEEVEFEEDDDDDLSPSRQRRDDGLSSSSSGSDSDSVSVSISSSSHNTPTSKPLHKTEKSPTSSRSPASGSSSSTPHSSGSSGSSSSGSSSSGSTASGSSSSSSSLFEGSKREVKRMSMAIGIDEEPKSRKVAFEEEEGDDSFETDSYETDESDEFETDSEEAKSPMSKAKSQGQKSPQKRKGGTDQSSDSISDQKRVSYNYGHDPNDHRKQKRPSVQSRTSSRHQSSEDVPSSISGKFKKIKAISEYSGDDEEDSVVVQGDVEYPDDSIVPEQKKKGFFGRILGLLTSGEQAAPKARREPPARKRRQPPPPAEDDGSQYVPHLYDDGISQVTDTNTGKKKAERSRPLPRELGRFDTSDSIPSFHLPRKQRSQQPSYLPSVASSHMSVRNTKAALSDMNPLSVRQARDVPPEPGPEVSRRNTKAALSSLRPLSIRNYPPGTETKKVALCELEPLSVGKSFTLSLTDDESSELRAPQYDVEYGMQGKYGSPGRTSPSDYPPHVDVEYMLRMDRERKAEKEKSRARQEAENRRRIMAQERAQRAMEDQRRVERANAMEGQRRVERANAVAPPGSSHDSDETSQDEKRPLYFRTSPLCICICVCICLLLLACIGVGIWALLKYVILEDDETPTIPTVAPTLPPWSSRPPTSVDLREQLLDTIVPYLPDNGDSFGDPESPQSLALDWLEQDPGVATYADEKVRRRYALAVFYYSTEGGSWVNKDRWLSDSDECTWYSAFDESPCLDQEYAYLVLGDNNLRGSLPPDLALLSNSLVGLDFGGTMSGSIPGEYGDLTNLEFLRIHGTNIDGRFSSNFKNLIYLETLDLYGNRMTGEIPPIVFSSLTRLKTLDLGKNRFSGSLSSQLGQLSALTTLSLQENNLAGSIPFEIGEMTNLRTLNLDSNGFTSLPRNLGFLTSLRLLSIRNNGLTGTIPGELGFLTELSGLYLDHNSLRWTIPPQLGQLTNLVEGLGLSNNLLVGKIPSELGRLFSLKNLYLDNNKLRGTVPSTLGNINRLHTLRLEANNLTGNMPGGVCSRFSREFSTFYVDCSAVTCSCCNFCCDDETSSECTCPFAESDPILCIP